MIKESKFIQIAVQIEVPEDYNLDDLPKTFKEHNLKYANMISAGKINDTFIEDAIQGMDRVNKYMEAMTLLTKNFNNGIGEPRVDENEISWY